MMGKSKEKEITLYIITLSISSPITNSNEQSPSREANKFSDSQDIWQFIEYHVTYGIDIWQFIEYHVTYGTDI